MTERESETIHIEGPGWTITGPPTGIAGLFHTGDCEWQEGNGGCDCGLAVRQAAYAAANPGGFRNMTGEPTQDPGALAPEGWIDPILHDLARVGYEAYRVRSGGKSVITGGTLPVFDDTPEAVQNAWESAAAMIRAVVLDLPAS